MKLKIVITSIVFIAILLCSSFLITSHNVGYKQYVMNKLQRAKRNLLAKYSIADGKIVTRQKVPQILFYDITKPLLVNSKTDDSRRVNSTDSTNNKEVLLLSQNNFHPNAPANLITPIVDSNQASGSEADSPDNGLGATNGNYNSIMPIVNSLNAERENTTIIYIAEYGNSVISCNVIKSTYSSTNGYSNNSGVIPTGLSGCAVVLSSANGLDGPDNLLVSKNNLYIVNYLSNSLTYCGLSNNGSIGNCNGITLPIESPVYITQVSQQQLYINAFPNSQEISSMVSCTTNSNGDIASCGNPSSINLALLPYPTINGYSYTTSYYRNGINKCLGLNCQLLSNILIPNPVAIYTSNNNAYIINDSSVVGCGIDSNSGNFFNCSILANNLNNSSGVTIYNNSNS